MTPQKINQSNPLVPLIVFFAFVILLTIIITNIREEHAVATAPPSAGNSGFLTLGSRHIDFVPRQQPPPEPLPPSYPDTRALLASASRDLENGLLDSAEDKLRTALVFEPANPRIPYALGMLMLRSGRDLEAEFFFKNQCRNSSEDSSALDNLASLQTRLGKYDDAIKNLEKALAINPDSGIMLVELAGCKALAGKQAEALDCFRKAYAKLGYGILQVANAPNLKSLRELPEFKEILEKASGDLAEQQAKEFDSTVPAPQPDGAEK